MIIAIVVDSYNDRSNGTSMSAFRFARELVKRGHEVRVVATFPRKYGGDSKDSKKTLQDSKNLVNLDSKYIESKNVDSIISNNIDKKLENIKLDSKESIESNIKNPQNHKEDSKENNADISRSLNMTDKVIESSIKNTKKLENIESKSDFIIGECGEKIYYVKERYIPLVSEVSRRQHMIFGYPDKKILKSALSGCDIAHFYLPFALEIAGVKLCRELQIPYIAAFHLQPEHISYNMGMNFAWFNRYLFSRFNRAIYRYCHHIHCPSLLMKEEIERANYGGKKYVISNGFNISSSTQDSKNPNNLSKNLENKEFFNIISVGRFSKEKRHKILIKAISKSKYVSRIKLHLHGSGPLESALKTMCESNLQNKADFGFLDNNILLEKLGKMQLYVHPAEVESEAISCLEAVACGVTPLIANSKVSATRQFALDNRSLFKVNDVQDLADKIDFWIENPTLLEQMRPLYAQSAAKYDLQKSIDSILQVYDETISDFKQNPQLFKTLAS